MKKGKSGKSLGSYFKSLGASLNIFAAYILLVIVALYFATDYLMTADGSQYVQYVNLTKDAVANIHHQLTLPFCVCMVIFIFPSLLKK